MSKSRIKAPGTTTKKQALAQGQAALKARKEERDFSSIPAAALPVPTAAPALPMTASEETSAFIAFLERASKDPTVDMGKMQALLAMKKEVLTEQKIAAFNRDFMLAKSEMPRIKKDGTVEYPIEKAKPDGPKKKAFDFAKYESIDKELRPIEQKFGFSRSFTTEPRAAGGGITVFCTLLHKDGHYITAAIPVPLDNSGGKNDLQGYGSSFSYGKRYTTTMIWDIVTEGQDDDGSGALQGQPIDDIQFAAFQALIDEHGIDVPKFCAHLKVESIKAISNKQYPKAMNDLKEAIRKRQEVAAREKGPAQP